MDLTDVDLGDAGTDRVDRLVERTSFDRDEAEAIVRFSKVDANNRDPTNIRSYVSGGNPDNGYYHVEDGLTPDECDRIRRNMNRASRPTTVIDAWPDKHPSVIFRHATGRCDHDGTADPTKSPRIEADECREMRVDFQTGDDLDTIGAAYNRSENTVVTHVFGRCRHDFDHKRNGRELSDALCRRMRRAYRNNDTASIADIGSAFIIGTSTAHRHLTGGCGHRDDVEAPIASNGPSDIDKSECDAMRAAYGRDTSPQDMADDFDRDVTSIRKHVFGRCRHDPSEIEPDRRSVSARLCKAIRYEYRTRGIESVASVRDRLNLTKGTFFYHLKGKCSHVHDVDPVDPSGSEV